MKEHFSRTGLLAILATLLLAVVVFLISTRPPRMSDAEFDESLSCNRYTLDVRSTDKYCGNRNLYIKECTGLFKKKSSDCEYK
jgi:hypothetical protein